jgi:iron complex outermembrane receptor protein
MKAALLYSTAVVAIFASAYDNAAIAADSDSGIETVVVTAEKTSKDIQRVPAAVTAVSGQKLVEMGVTDLSGVQFLVPSVRFQHQSDVTETFIRGIGSGFDGPWVPESVATNFNGQSLPRDLTGASLYDLASVEVLPGPQGTLYGRSAVGGVVNINAQRPTSDLNGYATVSAGNYGAIASTAVANIPLSDDFAVRAAFNQDYNDGYNKDGTYSSNSYAGRLSARYTPSNNFSVYVWGSYYHDRPNIAPLIYFPEEKNDPYNPPKYDSSSTPYYPPFGLNNTIWKGDYESETLGAEVKFTLGDAEFTYIPTYLHGNSADKRPIAGLLENNVFDINQVSQELRVANATPSRLSYIAGVYWLQNNTDTDYVLGPYFGGGHIPNRNQSLAFYGQTTYSITDAFRLTAGVRYSVDKTKNSNGQAFFPIFDPLTFTFLKGVVPYTFDKKWSHINWKGGFEYDIADTSMLYGNIQTGFNPGTYDSNAIPLNPDRAVLPQEVTAYTLGIKNRLLDDHLLLNVEGFYYDYKNLILQQYNAATGGIIIYNAPKSTIKGLQIDATYRITENDQISANLGFTDGHLEHFIAGGFNYSGFQLPSSPRTTATLGYQHIFDFGTDGNVTFNVNSYLSSGFWGLFDHSPGSHQGAYSNTDLTLTYSPASGNWDASLWVKNLEDNAILSATGESPQPYPRKVVAYVEPPRTYGVRLTYRFNP